ncbi:hypothetical protein SDJN03_14795, partial [Cucurbita argyrosperma subsp. sororia]
MRPLPDDSPPEDDLISSLHRHGTATFSASSTWKIRTNELAQDEILRERRAAMGVGKFMGRRLSFDDVDMGHALNTELLHGNYWNGFVQDQIVAPSVQSSDSSQDNRNRETGKEEEEEEVPVCLNGLSYSSASSSSSSSSGSFAPPQVKEEENVRASVGGKREIGNRCRIGTWEVGLACLAIASVVMLIFSARCLEFGAYEEERLPFLLVPT